MKRSYWSIVLTVCLLVGLTSNISQAAFTAGMTQQFKNNLLTIYLIDTHGLNGMCTGSSAPYTCCSGAQAGTCTPQPYFSIGLQSANTSIGPSTTTAASYTDLGTAYGYTTAGVALGSCTVASTGGSSPLAADFNCANAVWTVSGGGSLTADSGMLYEKITGVPVAFYTWSSATASGTGATFTVTMPTVASGTRGAAAIAEVILPLLQYQHEMKFVQNMNGTGVWYLVPVIHLG